MRGGVAGGVRRPLLEKRDGEGDACPLKPLKQAPLRGGCAVGLQGAFVAPC